MIPKILTKINSKMNKNSKMIIVFLLTPLYIVIQLLLGIYELVLPITQNISNVVDNTFDTMYCFWKKILKFK